MYNIKINTLPVLTKCLNKIKMLGTNAISLSEKEYNKLMNEITKNENLMCYFRMYDTVNGLDRDYLHALIVTDYNKSTTDKGKRIPIPDSDYGEQEQFYTSLVIEINSVQKTISIEEI